MHTTHGQCRVEVEQDQEVRGFAKLKKFKKSKIITKQLLTKKIHTVYYSNISVLVQGYFGKIFHKKKIPSET